MVELSSNAPSDWPSIRLSGIAPENWCDALAQTLSEAGLIVLDSQVPRLLSLGVLEVPLRVRDADSTYDIFFYPQADEASAAHFLAVLELAWNNAHLRPLFFSSGDLLSIYADELPSVIRQGRLYLRRLEQPPRGQYAIWWASGNEVFSGSKTEMLLDRWCRRVDGLEAFFAAQLLEELGMQRFEPLELPQEMLTIPVEGPDRIPMVVSFSAERGVRFHFHTKHTSPSQRELFLEYLFSYINLWLPQRREITPGPTLKWWYTVNKRIQSVTVIDSPTPQGVAVLGSINR